MYFMCIKLGSILQVRKNFIIFLCFGIFFYGMVIPKARAMDPVTIAILAPIVMPYAVRAADYTIKGLIKTIPGWIKAGTEVLNILRLPLGVGQIFLGLPFGLAGYGFGNIAKGTMAPVLFFKEVLCMPLYFFGATM
jgi:hypothetical protein